MLFLITKGNVWGGAQRYVYDLATGLQGKFDISVVTGVGGILNERLDEAGIPTREIPHLNRDLSFSKDILSIFYLAKILRAEKPDVLHLNSSKGGLFGAMAGRLAGVRKIIFTSHGWAFNEDRFFAGTKALFWLMHALTVLLCHKVIAASGAVEKDARHFPGADRKISVIHHGIREPRFLDRGAARGAIEEKTGRFLSGDKVLIGTIAELHPVKGLNFAIEAIEECMKENLPVEYVIIGGGELEKKLKELVVMKDLEGKVFLAGFIPDAATLLKAFDIFLLPSVSESFGYVIAEAGLAELPVIATNVGGIPEVVDESTRESLIPPRSSGAIATALEPLIQNPLTRSQYGKTLKRHIEEKFSLEEMLKKTSVLYLE